MGGSSEAPGAPAARNSAGRGGVPGSVRTPAVRVLTLALLAAACRPVHAPARRVPADPVAAVVARDAGGAAATLTATTVLDRGLVDRDLALLRATFAALHPGLHRYLTPAELERAYAEVGATLGPRPTLAATYLALTRLTARLRCGHTYLNFFNQSPAVQRALFEGPRLPFGFRWLDGRMVITRAFVDEPALAPGTEVVAIGELTAAALLAELMPLVRADGGDDDKRRAELGVRGAPRLETFDIFTGLLHPELGRPGRYRLTVRRPDGTRATVTVPAMTHAERLAAVSPPAVAPGAGPAPLWALARQGPGVAYLKMPRWVTHDTTWDWRADLDRVAAELVTAADRALIVDLRGNEGGSDVGDHLLRHLIDAPIVGGGLERWVRYRTVPPALRGPLDTWDPSFFDWGEDAVDRGGGYFRLVEPDGSASGAALTPLAPRFRGRVIVLVDAANSSATFQFAQRVQRYRLATLIGEPTGGNQRGINGGAFFFVRLPGTGLEVDLPLIGRFPADGDLGALPDAGIVPDIVVRTTAADLAAGRDPQLTAALALARR